MIARRILFVLFVLSLGISFISAAGCCFNPSTGMCAMNSEEDPCITEGGEFYESSSCSVAKCDRGCCLIASNTGYMTGRECQLQSQTFGFSYPGNFQGMEETDCLNLGLAQEKGACIYDDGYEKSCSYGTYSECHSGNFHANAFCTAPELNSTCKATNNTMCYDENLYGKDSCGNPDGLKQACDYSAGLKCERKSSTEAYCKDLNCEGLANGQSICMFDSTEYSAISELTGEDPFVVTPVGSRFFRKYCLNGELIKEPCGDFRMEFCSMGEASDSSSGYPEAKCENNPWQECLSAGNDTEECDEEYCYMFDPSLAHCVSNPSGGGYCTIGDDTTKWYPATVSGDSFTFDGSENSANNPPVTKDQAVQQTGAGMTYGSKSNRLIAELHMERCLPKIPGGLNIYGSSDSSSSSNSAEATCSMGNFETTVYLESDAGCDPQWALAREGNADNYIDTESTTNPHYGNAGIISSEGSDWTFYFCEHKRATLNKNNPIRTTSISCNSDDQTCAKNKIIAAFEQGKIPDEVMSSSLVGRCNSLGDCDGKANWVGTESGEMETPWTMSCSNVGSNGDAISCSFNFECLPWEAPEGDTDCEKCGQDDLPCSEYRCKSLGDCTYYEDTGVNNGYCMASSDNVGPVISASINPKSPIPPYTPIELTATTSEMAKCKFSINKAPAKYEDMQYDLGTGYLIEHKVILTLPGQINGMDENETQKYSVISRDGNYTVYIRCKDPAGNGQISSPTIINFEVMPNPDKIPPILSKFSPISGSRIKFNTTEKLISFELDAPAQCRWDFEETYNISKMRYNFSCDESLVDNPMYVYKCLGTLTNITLALENETTFYIRCKDQPWFAADTITENGVDYSRNEMDNAYVYKLRPSEKFFISEVSPRGLTKVSGQNANVSLTVFTYGGAFYGKSKCYWKLSEDSSELENLTLKTFKSTDSSVSTQIINPFVGDNFASVKCEDDVGNEDRKEFSFNILIDSSSPFISRLFEKLDKLKIKTDEDSLCYYSFNKIANCLFDITNATMMSGLYSSEHDAPWQDDKVYYIKCKDYYGNIDTGCNKIIRTY
jgi:hypothetical protein